jgi:homoserine kinase
VRFTVRVPATSANLGPGYDSFGLALDLCNDVRIDTEAEPGVSWDGEGSGELPTDGSDLVTRSMRRVAEHARTTGRPDPLPAVRIEGTNRIPLERGLGSSSAAVVAGVAAARHLLGLSNEDLAEVFGQAFEVEGHPDNVAAATHGGFTIVAGDVVQRLEPHPDLRPAVLVPTETRLSTTTAREALAPRVDRRDAVFNLSCAALVAVGLVRAPELLWHGLRDRLHEQARMALVPEVGAVLEELRGRMIPACVSGAGPSLLAFESGGRRVPELGPGWRVLRPAVRARGFEVLTA